MSTAKRLAWISGGYALAIVAGFAAVALNELSMSEEASQGSPGMVAFGDVIIFVLAAGVVGLIPTLFLLKLLVEKAPRALILVELVVAALGPLSWLGVWWLASAVPDPSHPRVIWQILGPFIAVIGIPRIVLGPVVVVIEGLTFILIRGRAVRLLLIAAALMDVIPIALYAWHMTRGPHY
jgi:hypothetical protein